MAEGQGEGRGVGVKQHPIWHIKLFLFKKSSSELNLMLENIARQKKEEAEKKGGDSSDTAAPTLSPLLQRPGLEKAFFKHFPEN